VRGLKRIALIVIGSLLLIGCNNGGVTAIPEATATEPPVVTEEAGDDIVSTPGGYAYRANVTQQGVDNPWPTIVTAETIIGDDDPISVRYRDHIQTLPGETRSNLLLISKTDINELSLYIVENLGNDVSVTEGLRYHGFLSSVMPVLFITFPQNAEAGEYSFDIGFKINGRDYGTIPCTVEISLG